MKSKIIKSFLLILAFLIGGFCGYKLTDKQFIVASKELNKERIRIYNSVKDNFGIYDSSDESIKQLDTINLFKNMDFYIVEYKGIKTIRCAE